MLITASVGLGVNSINLILLHDSSHHDINLRGAFLHIVADAISSIGVILAAMGVKPPLALTLFRYCNGNGLIQLLA